MPQTMPMKWTMLYITFLATFLMFNIVNYFIQSPNEQLKAKKITDINKTNWKW